MGSTLLYLGNWLGEEEEDNFEDYEVYNRVPIGTVVGKYCNLHNNYIRIHNEKNQRRTFTRPGGNIGIQLRKERITVTDAYLSCQSLLKLSDEQVSEFQRRNY